MPRAIDLRYDHGDLMTPPKLRKVRPAAPHDPRNALLFSPSGECMGFVSAHDGIPAPPAPIEVEAEPSN